MKRTILFFGWMLLSVLSITALANNAARPVEPIEYIRTCQLYGDGWYYIPGTDTCIFPTTGEIRYQDRNGNTVAGQTKLAYRVTRLEQSLAELKALKKQKTGK